MDSTLRSYLTEALYANVTTETFFEEDEEEINGVADTDYKEGVTRLSSINSFKSIAYIDDDVESEESETGCKDEENHVVDNKVDCHTLNDEYDEVFQSDPSYPTDSTSDSEESFRTAPNTLSREEGIACNEKINSASFLKDEKDKNKKRRIFASVGDIMTNISPGFTRKLSLRRLRGREQKFSDPSEIKNGRKWSFGLSRSHSTKDFSRNKNYSSGSFDLNSCRTVEESENHSCNEYSAKLQAKNRKSSFSNGNFFRKNALKRTLTSCSVNSVISNLNRSLSFRNNPNSRSQSFRSLRSKQELSRYGQDINIDHLNNQNKIKRRY